jgi:hypothetical protein
VGEDGVAVEVSPSPVKAMSCAADTGADAPTDGAEAAVITTSPPLKDAVYRPGVDAAGQVGQNPGQGLVPDTVWV